MFKTTAGRKKSRGFTLAEVLIVVAIIGILLAVAIPNVIGYYRSLKLTELDDSARSIFTAAQNRLTALKNEGRELNEIGTHGRAETSTGAAVSVNYVVKPSTSDPHAEAMLGDLRTVLPGGSVDTRLQDNNMVIEFVPDTGAVFAVWYWEKGDFAYRDAYGTVKPDKDSRLSKMVGYYGGSNIDRPSIGQTPIPAVEIINAEELVLNISVPETGLSSVKANVTITASDGSRSEVQIVSGATLYKDIPKQTYSGRIALDTLKGSAAYPGTNADFFLADGKGKSFKEWVKDNLGITQISPGADFDIEVEITAYDGTGTQYLPQTVYCEGVNSLFASVDGSTARIAYGRHLQNLDVKTSGVTDSITRAEQTQEIDFKKTGDELFSWADTYEEMPATGSTPAAIRRFTSIANENLLEYNGQGMPIRNMDATGQGNYAGLFASFGDDYGGKNSKYYKLSNITLINPAATVENNGPGGASCAGALVGFVPSYRYLTITNCLAYLEDKYIFDAAPRITSTSNYSYAGGLVGIISSRADVTIRGSSASVVVYGNGNTCRTGGLVGSISECDDMKIEQSYAACYLREGANSASGDGYIGGLVGYSSTTGFNLRVENSYAAGIIEIDNGRTNVHAGGLIGFLPVSSTRTPTITNSYAAVRYGNNIVDASKAASSTVKIYGVANFASAATAYYVAQNGVAYTIAAPAVGTPKKGSEIAGVITGAAWSAGPNEEEDATPYNQIDETKDLEPPYPYPMLQDADGNAMHHYGDWLEGGYVTSFYWEKEGSGTDPYHFYLVLSDGAARHVADGLCSDHHPTANMGQAVDEWGYGLIGIDGAAVTAAGLVEDASVTKTDITTPLKSFLTGTPTTPVPWDAAPPNDALENVKTLLGDDNNVILLAHTGTDDFHAIETDAGRLELNLGFAAAIDVTEDNGTALAQATYMGKNAPDPTAPDADRYVPYQIRTVRQLDNIPDGSSGDQHTGNYKQTHDLNGQEYKDVAGNPIYDGADFFAGSYDGGSYRILNLTMAGTGVFYRLDGCTLQNVILYSPDGTAEVSIGSDTGSLGGLARSVADHDTTTIRNCIVAGYKIRQTCASGLGGLVGYVLSGGSLSIENCAAVNDLIVEFGGPSTVNVGGLVGEKSGNTDHGHISIKDSYAGGTISAGGVSTSVGRVGGIVGSYGLTASCTYSNVYSYVDMSGITSTSATFYGIGPAKARTASTSGYENCRYWANGLGAHAPSDASFTGVAGVNLEGLKVTTGTAAQTYKPNTDFTKGLENLTGDAAYPYAPVVHEVIGYDPDGTPVLGDPVHYGGWPVINPSAGYVEIYPAGSTRTYGVYAYLSDQTGMPLVNTLIDPVTIAANPGAPTCAEDDCYGLLVPHGEACPDTFISTGGALKKDTSATAIEDICEDLTSGETYDFYRCTFEPTTPGAPAGYYHSVTLNGQEFWFNTDYACEIVKAPTGSADMSEPLTKEDTASLGPAGADDYEAVIIRTARQLAKMAEATGSTGVDGNAAQLRAYEQLLDIDYAAYAGAGLDVGRPGDDPQPPAALWRRNASTGTGVTAKTGSYNGNDHTISNLSIKGSSNKVGLFGELGTANTVKIQNITLVDVTVDGGGYNQVGALAGNVTNGTVIENCGVYISDAAGKYAAAAVTGKNNVGGLLGQLGSRTSVQNCFAAVRVEGENYVGGFVGQINGSAGIGNCYSGGRTVDGQYVDSSINVKATNGAAGGFVGEISNDSGGTYQNIAVISGSVLYSTCSVAGSSDKAGLFAGDVGEHFSPGTTPDPGQQTVRDTLKSITVYGLGAAYKYDNATDTYTQIDPRNESAYTADLSKILATDAVAAEPYDGPLGSGPAATFPYRSAADMPHRGDWPAGLTEAVFYWEQESAGAGTNEYRFYARVRVGSSVLTYDTLCTDHFGTAHDRGISDYGYGTFTTDSTAITLVRASGGSASEDTGTNVADVQSAFKSAVLDFLDAAVSGGNYNMYSSSNSAVSENAKARYAVQLGYAAAIDVTYDPSEQGKMGKADTPYQIRTAGQLDNISGTSSSSNKSCFRQTHDIDGSGYTETGGSAKYTANNYFAGTFDGGGYVIKNLGINGGGLFGTVTGSAEFKNIILYSTDGSAVSGAGPSGGIISSITGGDVNITNCAVAGCSISGAANIGGLVGTMSGTSLTVSSCEAVNTLIGNDNSCNAGGLVGAASGAVTVRNSYAGGSIKSGAAGTPGSLQSVGGIVGSGTGAYENVYSYMDMTDPGLVGTTSFYGIGQGANNECYYLAGKLVSSGDSSTAFADADELKGKLADASASGSYKDGFGDADADHTYPSGAALTGGCPYPAVVRVDGAYVHYGDWPEA